MKIINKILVLFFANSVAFAEWKLPAPYASAISHFSANEKLIKKSSEIIEVITYLINFIFPPFIKKYLIMYIK